MTIAYASSTFNSGSTGSTIVGNKPSGTVEGNLLLAILSIDGDRSWTMPSGWTETIDEQHTGATDTCTLGFAWKIAGASEGSSYTFTESSTGRTKLVVIIRLTGNFDTNPIDVFDTLDSTYDGEYSSDPVCPAISPTQDPTFLIACFSANDNNYTGGEDTGYPSGYTGLYARQETSGGDASIGVAYKAYTGTSSTGTATFLMDDDRWVAAHITIYEDGSGGSPQTVTPTVIGLSAGNQAPSLVPGGASVSPSVQGISISPQTPTLVAGGVSISPSVQDVSTSTQAPTVVPGGASVSPSVQGVSVSPQAPTLAPGGVSLSPTTAGVNTSIQTPTVSDAGLFASPGVLDLSAEIQAPTVVPAGVSLSPSTVSVNKSIQAPTLVIGGRVLSPNVFDLSGAIHEPIVVPGGMPLSPSTVELSATIQASTLSEEITVTPDTIGISTNVQVIALGTGAITLTPDVIRATVSIQSPDAALLTLLTPDTINLSAEVASPSLFELNLVVFIRQQRRWTRKVYRFDHYRTFKKVVVPVFTSITDSFVTPNTISISLSINSATLTSTTGPTELRPVDFFVIPEQDFSFIIQDDDFEFLIDPTDDSFIIE